MDNQDQRTVIVREEVARESNVALVIGFFVLAIAMVTLAVWRPWNAVSPTSNTVIHEAQQAPPQNDTTIIVPGQSDSEPNRNEINVENGPQEPSEPNTPGEATDSQTPSGESTAGEDQFGAASGGSSAETTPGQPDSTPGSQ